MRKSIKLLVLVAMMSLVSACGNNETNNKVSNSESSEIETTIEETTIEGTTVEETTTEETANSGTTSESSDVTTVNDGNVETNKEVKAKVWIQDAYDVENQGVRVSGLVEYGTFYVSDETYIVKKDGTEIKVDVTEILQARVPVDKVEEGGGISVAISNIDRESVERDEYIVIY